MPSTQHFARTCRWGGCGLNKLSKSVNRRWRTEAPTVRIRCGRCGCLANWIFNIIVGRRLSGFTAAHASQDLLILYPSLPHC